MANSEFEQLVGKPLSTKLLKIKVSDFNDAKSVIEEVSNNVSSEEVDTILSNVPTHMKKTIESLSKSPYSGSESNFKTIFSKNRRALSVLLGSQPWVLEYFDANENRANTVADNITKYISDKKTKKRSKVKKIAKAIRSIFFDPDTVKIIFAALCNILLKRRVEKERTKAWEEKQKKEKEEKERK